MRNPIRIPRDELAKALVMAVLFFLVISTVGILKPIRNAFALDGLAASEFYKVYLISAAVIFFVFPYNRLADRVPWRWLIPGVALFFAASLLVFRALYREGSTTFGVTFYGWYDLYTAVMVTQFFMATQLFFNARDAKRLYPFAIAGGSIGGVFGAAITGFFIEIVGGPNLLLVAAAFVVIFALTIPVVWTTQQSDESHPGVRRQEKLTAGEFATIVRNRHVLLIAAAVLLTVLVKQLVDYQFNEISKEVFATRDAIGAFQGKFFAATQWLPLLVLLTLRPLLKRWGVGLVVMLLPAVLLAANLALAVSWSLVWAIVAKAGDSSIRYTAERAGREILYVPLPQNIKLKAKAYIDMAVEKGLGKVLSAVLIFVVVLLVDYRKVGWVGVGLGAVWLLVALAVRAEYVRTLARSIQGRFASFDGIFASMADASTIPVIQETLTSDDERSIAFALDLVDQADPASAQPLLESIHGLLSHPSPRIRERAIGALASFPEDIDTDRVRMLLEDSEDSVRVAAVGALCRSQGAEPERVMSSLLAAAERPVRMAALACLAGGGVPGQGTGLVEPGYLDRLMDEARRDGAARIELAMALLVLGSDPRVPDALGPLLRDPDPKVAEAALRTAGRLGRREFVPRLITALGSVRTRDAAREALAWQGERIEGTLSDYLADESVAPNVRRNIPAVLARIPAQSTVDDILRFLAGGVPDRLLRYRALKALNKLRARAPDLVSDAGQVNQALDRELEAGSRYAAAGVGLQRLDLSGPAADLLRRSVKEAWFTARECVFRLLGLLHEPEGIYRAYLTLVGGSSTARANALEWLEQTVGHFLFVRLESAVQEAANGGDKRWDLREGLSELMRDEDLWLANCATWTALELGDPWVREELERLRESASVEHGFMAERALARLYGRRTGSHPESGEMNLIEKVFLLQQVDLLSDARAEDLALLASIAEELDVKPGTVLLRQDEPTEAMYIVIHGAVELRRAGEQVLTAQDGSAFGTWALIDESPSLVAAKAVERSELLCITREDFYDLLAEHSELARGLLKGLARRVRALVA